MKRSALLDVDVLRLLFVVYAIAASSLVIAGPVTTEPWRQLARTDLDFVHRTIAEAHPGAIDPANPSFRVWMEAGYRQALTLLPQVTDFSTALAAVRWYVRGFRDGHLIVSDDTRPHGELIASKGWGISYIGGQYVVTSTATRWPAPLPPLGATLASCDGRSPEAIAAEDVAPYVDRRDLPMSKRRVAHAIGEPVIAMGHRLDSCTFDPQRGEAPVTLVVVYRLLPFDQWAKVTYGGIPSRDHTDDYQLRDGLLWIRAGNFNPTAERYVALKRMADELRHLEGVRAIVFDVRGNGGGNSAIGDLLFDAATGGLRYDRRGLDRLPEIYAEWRVSDVSIETAKSWLATTLVTYGHGSSEVEWARDHLRSLLVAQAKGTLWARQDSSSRRLTRNDMIRRHARLRHFAGPIAVLTDEYCASACLDFVDQIRLVPGALQLGATTSADSVYIDTGRVRLPSGNHLVLPLKVWRNRLRGNNQPWVPDVAFDGNLGDDEAVRKWVVSILDKRWSSQMPSAKPPHARTASRPWLGCAPAVPRRRRARIGSGSSRRSNRPTHPRVAYSTASRWRHGLPSNRISAIVLSYSMNTSSS